MSSRIIQIHALAPAKPQPGKPCNGCGVCCLHEPCPLGMLLSRRRHGACAVLHWESAAGRYRCGAMVAPAPIVRAGLPSGWDGLVAVLTPALRRMAGRWIAAGKGCDSTLQVQTTGTDAESDGQSSS